MSRIITAIIFLPILIASILIASLQPLFVLLAAAAMVLGLYEFYLLAARRVIEADRRRGYLASVALFIIFYFATPNPTSMQDRLDVQSLILILLI